MTQQINSFKIGLCAKCGRKSQVVQISSEDVLCTTCQESWGCFFNKRFPNYDTNYPDNNEWQKAYNEWKLTQMREKVIFN